MPSAVSTISQTMLVARHEIRCLAREGRLRVVGVATLLLLVSAVAVSLRQSRVEQAAHEQAVEAERAEWLSQGTKNPHGAAHHGTYAFAPRSPLAFFDPGVSPFTGISTRLEAHHQNLFENRPSDDTTTLDRFDALTPAFMVQVMMPLVIILLTFSSLAGEREAGILPLAFAQGMPFRRLVVGKTLGAAVVLLALLAVPVTLAALLVFTVAPVESALDLTFSVFLLILLHLLYWGIFLFLSIAVSARAPNARVALTTLFVIWVAVCWVIPRASVSVIDREVPVPSVAGFQAAISRQLREGIDGHNPSDQRAEQLKARLLRQYGVSRVEDLPVNFDGVALQESEEYGARVFDRNFSSLWDLYRRQDRLRTVVSVLSPLLAVRPLSMALAGTDNDSHLDFVRAAEDYRRRLVGFLNDDMIHNAGSAGYQYHAKPDLWRRAPEFKYRPVALNVRLAGEIASLACLLAWFILSGAIALCTSPPLDSHHRT